MKNNKRWKWSGDWIACVSKNPVSFTGRHEDEKQVRHKVLLVNSNCTDWLRSVPWVKGQWWQGCLARTRIRTSGKLGVVPKVPRRLKHAIQFVLLLSANGVSSLTCTWERQRVRVRRCLWLVPCFVSYSYSDKNVNNGKIALKFRLMASLFLKKLRWWTFVIAVVWSKVGNSVIKVSALTVLRAGFPLIIGFHGNLRFSCCLVRP